jgi:hypothetical protein
MNQEIMMKMKRLCDKNLKGQIAGQVFIYMMAVIVVGAIALIGYKALTTISDKACQAEKASFKIDIENMIEKYTSDGSITPEKINAPCQYDTICFVDTSMIGNADNEFQCTENYLIWDSVNSGIRQNMFVISNEHTIPIGYSELISLNSEDGQNRKCLCIKQRNKNFYIRFVGRGSTTEIDPN